jgi:hypothetical protein
MDIVSFDSLIAHQIPLDNTSVIILLLISIESLEQQNPFRSQTHHMISITVQTMQGITILIDMHKSIHEFDNKCVICSWI